MFRVLRVFRVVKRLCAAAVLLAAGLALSTASSYAEDDASLPSEAGGAYVLDPSHASITFRISHLGFSQYTGRFNTLTAKLMLDAQTLSKSQLSATVTPTSVDVNNTELQDKLKGPDFFNITQFPDISFTSRKIMRTGPKTGQVTGDLTLLGITKPLTLNVTFNNAGMNPYASVYTLGFSATGTLRRSDWGMKALTPSVGDDVTLQIEAEFHKENTPWTP